jgi:ATP-dependent DNA ligase
VWRQYKDKFDGFRAQPHKAGLAATISGKNGGDLTRRFPTIAAAVLVLPAGLATAS